MAQVCSGRGAAQRRTGHHSAVAQLHSVLHLLCAVHQSCLGSLELITSAKWYQFCGIDFVISPWIAFVLLGIWEKIISGRCLCVGSLLAGFML